MTSGAQKSRQQPLRLWKRISFQTILSFGDSYKQNLIKMNPARVACQLVEPIYFWFGLKIEEIPYLKTENSTRMIDVDVIARGGK